MLCFRRRGLVAIDEGDATGAVATTLLLAISLSSPNTIGSDDDDDANRKMRESSLFMIDVIEYDNRTEIDGIYEMLLLMFSSIAMLRCLSLAVDVTLTQ